MGNFRLVETGFAKKNDYMAYLKDYMKKIVKYLEDNNRAAEVDTFKKNINGVMKGLLGKFSDLQFYQGKGTFLEYSIAIFKASLQASLKSVEIRFLSQVSR